MGPFVYLTFIAALYPLAWLIKRTSDGKKRKKRDRVMRNVHETGRVIYRDKVYTVREVCDAQYYNEKGLPLKYLIVSRPGEERVFKIAIDEAEPCPPQDEENRAIRYK